ncbi:MAG: YceD family protein [Serpentinimonas sp.]|nr:YceD family protein [Serpentinimonas sp.]
MTLPTPATRPKALDLRALADSGQTLQGELALAELARWGADAPPWPTALEPLRWQALAQWRADPASVPGAGRSEGRQLWLHLRWAAQVPLRCQRCLEPYLEPLQDERWFRFVADEARAQAEDEECAEDLLVWVPRFNLQELIEDELLLALPLVPMHEACPSALPGYAQAAADGVEEPQRPNPFEVLAQRKPG